MKKECDRIWEEMTDEVRAVYKQLHKSWQSSPPLVVAKKSSPPYGGIWGGGCLYSPTSACELWRHIKETGWPSDEEVFGDKSCFVDAEEGINFDDYAMFDCLGCLRSASGICQKDFERDPQIGIVHQGITNYLAYVEREVVTSGSLMLMVEGALAESSSNTCRRIFIITGSMWSPKGV